MPRFEFHGPPCASFVWQDVELIGEVSAIHGDPIEDPDATFIEYYDDEEPRPQTRQAKDVRITCGDFAGSAAEYQHYLISLKDRHLANEKGI